ncbi:hypothetical protein BGZ50_004368 [Haplosporangium sp. Z 11]|nr:hypothetical protein BGZ50_004368 [Haplosporangium sp. Z 11]
MDIPEILQQTAQYLDPKSLVAATLVSRHWYNCCCPILWKTISHKDWQLAKFTGRLLYAHGHLVRSLEWHSSHAISFAAAFSAATAATGTGVAGEPETHTSTSQSLSLSLPSAGSYYMMGLEFAGMMGRMGMIPPPPPQLAQSPTFFSTHTNKVTTDQQYLTSHHHHNYDVRCSKNPASTAGTMEEKSPIRQQLSLVCLNKIVGQCLHLQKLCLHGERDGIHVEMVQAIQSLSYLQSLELYAHKIVVDQDTMRASTWLLNIQDLLKGLVQLQSLTLRGTAFSFLSAPSCQDNNDDRDDINANPIIGQTDDVFTTPTSFPIRRISLDTPTLSESGLTFLLRQCPHLESLDLPGGISWDWSDDFIQSFAHSCPRLQEFSINSSSFPPVPEDRLTALIQGVGPLRRFGARSCLVGDSTFAALQEYSPDLEILDISLTRGHGLSKAKLYEYLRHAKGLKHLEADGVWILLEDVYRAQDTGENQSQEYGQQQEQHHEPQQQHSEQQQQQQLQGHLQLPSPERPSCHSWVSQDTLQYLNIGFTSPDRGTQRCHAMFTLLSSLTSLEHLYLSYTCLSLTPVAGFHQLKSLTRLRTFSIETCGYAPLNREDVLWMVTAWPKIEKIFVNLPGSSKERQLRAWLKEAHREDVVIESQQSMLW